MHQPGSQLHPGFAVRPAGTLARAVQAGDLIDNRDAILLDHDTTDGCGLRDLLRAAGIAVHLGPHALSADSAPVVLLGQSAYRRDTGVLRARLDLCRAMFPDAPICLVTAPLAGPAQPYPPGNAAFDDARAVLQAARIGFVSAQEV